MAEEKSKKCKKSKIDVIDFGIDFKNRNKDVLMMEKSMNGSVPEMHTINNTKLAQVIATREICNRGPVAIKVSEDGRTTTLVDVSGEMDVQKISGGSINQIDLLIVDAIYSLLRNGQTVMTPMLIMRTILGDCGKRMRINENELGWLRAEIEKMCKIRITINYEAEAKRRKIRGGEFIITSNFLNLDELQIKLGNGETANAYVYNARFAPPIYRYAEDVNQIITYPAKLLSNGKTSTKIDVVEIKNYVIKRIKIMKNPRNKIVSNRIAFVRYDKNAKEDAGLMPTLGLDASNKNVKHRVVKLVTEFLDELVKEKMIAEYSVYKSENKKTIEGVEIVL